MADASHIKEKWREAHTPAERLKWARLYWQARSSAINGSATDAANSMGIEPGTYRAYERNPGASKWIEINHQDAIRFGRKFQVRWPWLLVGEGTPFDEARPPAQERVLRAMESANETEQAVLADMIEAFVRRRAAG